MLILRKWPKSVTRAQVPINNLESMDTKKLPVGNTLASGIHRRRRAELNGMKFVLLPTATAAAAAPSSASKRLLEFSCLVFSSKTKLLDDEYELSERDWFHFQKFI